MKCTSVRKLMHANTWSPVSDAVQEYNGLIRKWGLAGGSKSLRVGLGLSYPGPISCSFTLCFWTTGGNQLTSLILLLPFLLHQNGQNSPGTWSQNKSFLS